MRAVIFFQRFVKEYRGYLLSIATVGMCLIAQAYSKDKATTTDIVFDKSITPPIKVEAVDWPKGFAQPKTGGEYADKKDDKWVAISAEFITEKEMTEEVRIVVHVEAYDTLVSEDGPDNGKLLKSSESPKFVVLKGETTFINVYKGKHLVTFYIHPSIVKRYGGGERSGRGFTNKTSDKTNNIRFEAFTKSGAAAEYLDRITDTNENWTTSAPAVDKAVSCVTDSPWWPSDAPKYEQIKIKP